jgi:hypothetical protein
MTSPAKTSAALGWAESAERVADPVARAQAKTLAWVATRITRQTGLPVATTLDEQPTEELYRISKSLRLQAQEAEAQRHTVEALIDDRLGRVEWATWHRCAARALRTGDAKDKGREAEAFAALGEVARVAPGRNKP